MPELVELSSFDAMIKEHGLAKTWKYRQLDKLSEVYKRFRLPVRESAGHVGSLVIIAPELFSGKVLHFIYCFKDMLIQPVIADRAVVAFNVPILLWISGMATSSFYNLFK